MAKLQKPRVIFQPAAYAHLQRGVNQLLNAIRPTLGPYPGLVALTRINEDRLELLDDGGLIARRVIQLADREADMGAMMVRQMLWRLHETVGDGTATAAVLFQIIYNEGLRYITAGGNAMFLRRYLEEGLKLMLDQLSGMTLQVKGKKQLAQIAASTCYDQPLARMLGEIFDIIGEHGRLEIRSGRSLALEREYVEGMYWKGGLLSRQGVTDPARVRTDVEEPAILISDLEVKDPRQLLPAMSLAMGAGYKSMLLIVKSISDLTVGLLTQEKTLEKLRVVPVKTPGFGANDQAADLQDLAILTGGRPLVSAAGQTLESVKQEDLGRARRAWADPHNFGLSGGKGDSRQLRQHIAHLRGAYSRIEDNKEREKLQQRIGKLLGGSATLWIGGATELELKSRRELAERTAQALRGAVLEGALPGGGAALLACRPLLQQRLEGSRSVDERAAYRILLRAVEEPARTLLSNAGYEASAIMGRLNRAGVGYGFDLNTQQVVDMAQAGIVDVAHVQKEAVRAAIATAALALTIDVLVHRKKPSQSLEP
jgi:chaperonin GroEL